MLVVLLALLDKGSTNPHKRNEFGGKPQYLLSAIIVATMLHPYSTHSNPLLKDGVVQQGATVLQTRALLFCDVREFKDVGGSRCQDLCQAFNNQVAGQRGCAGSNPKLGGKFFGFFEKYTSEKMKRVWSDQWKSSSNWWGESVELTLQSSGLIELVVLLSAWRARQGFRVWPTREISTDCHR